MAVADPWLQGLRRFKLLDVTTFRRSGDAVTTPVRFAIDGDVIIVSLDAASGKVKRLRNNPAVRVAGHPDGPARDAHACFVGDAALAALRRRHRFLYLQRLVLGRRPGRHVAAEIRPDPAEPSDPRTTLR